jgi:hypothetical protein
MSMRACRLPNCPPPGPDPNAKPVAADDATDAESPQKPSTVDRLLSCAADHFGVSELLNEVRALSYVGAVPIKKTWLDYPVVGKADKYTNLISVFGHEVFPKAKMSFQFAGTARLFGMIGRVNPIVSAGFAAYDVYGIGSCMAR